MTQRESLDAELIRYTDRSPKDDRLIQALGNLADFPTDKLRIDRLSRVIRAHVEPWLMTKISSSLKQHSDLGAALNTTYSWMLNTDPKTNLPRILSFEAWEASCTQESLANWIYNKSLCHRLKDLLAVPIDREKRFRKGSRNNPQALDSSNFVRLGSLQASGDGTLVQDPPAPGLSLVDTVAHQALHQEFEDYLHRDPDGLLGRCQNRDGKCNARILVGYLLQQAERPSMREIGEAIGVDQNTVDYQWKNKVLPLLTEVFTEIADRHGIVVDLTNRDPIGSKKKNSDPCVAELNGNS
jgi:hypothetical protein